MLNWMWDHLMEMVQREEASRCEMAIEESTEYELTWGFNTTPFYYSYKQLLESIGNIVMWLVIGDYQGDIVALLTIGHGDNKKYGYLTFGYGSCSYCDTMEAILDIDCPKERDEALEELREEMRQRIVWGTAHETLRRARRTDWKGQHFWYEDGFEYIHNAILNVLEEVSNPPSNEWELLKYRRMVRVQMMINIILNMNVDAQFEDIEARYAKQDELYWKYCYEQECFHDKTFLHHGPRVVRMAKQTRANRKARNMKVCGF